MKSKQERTMLITIQDYWDNSYLFSYGSEWSHIFTYKEEKIYKLGLLTETNEFHIETYREDNEGYYKFNTPIDKNELVEIVVRDIDEEFEELTRDKIALDLLISKYKNS